MRVGTRVSRVVLVSVGAAFAVVVTPAPCVHAQESLTAARRENAYAVRELIAGARKLPRSAAAFDSCVALARRSTEQSLNATLARVRAGVGGAADRAANERIVTAHLNELSTISEGMCAWRVIAWQEGVTNLTASQFLSDASLLADERAGLAVLLRGPERGMRMELNASNKTVALVIGLMCRGPSAMDKFAVSEASLACAMRQAARATSYLRSNKLSDTSFARLDRLLGAPPLGDDLGGFNASAMTGFAYSRMTPANLAIVCGVNC